MKSKTLVAQIATCPTSSFWGYWDAKSSQWLPQQARNLRRSANVLDQDTTASIRRLRIAASRLALKSQHRYFGSVFLGGTFEGDRSLYGSISSRKSRQLCLNTYVRAQFERI